MEKEKMNRLNELAHKAKNQGLTDEEAVERAALRKEYIDAFKKNMRNTLESIVIQEEDGTMTPLKKKTAKEGDHHKHHHGENCSCGCHHDHDHDTLKQ